MKTIDSDSFHLAHNLLSALSASKLRLVTGICLLVFLGMTLPGCSGNNCIPFGGSVTFEDGTPIPVGRVGFSTGTYMAEGIIDSQGKYQLSSLGKNDGLPPGEYKVVLTGVQESVGKDLTSETMVCLIDPAYTDIQTTPLTCTVSKQGERTFDISVPRNKKLKTHQK